MRARAPQRHSVRWRDSKEEFSREPYFNKLSDILLCAPCTGLPTRTNPRSDPTAPIAIDPYRGIATGIRAIIIIGKKGTGFLRGLAGQSTPGPTAACRKKLGRQHHQNYIRRALLIIKESDLLGAKHAVTLALAPLRTAARKILQRLFLAKTDKHCTACVT